MPRLDRFVLFAVLTAPIAFRSLASQSSPDSTRGRRRIVPLPAVASAPETGLQLGFTTLAVFEPAPMRHARPATILPTILRSTKGQTRASVDAEYWTAHNARRLQAQLAWQKFPLPFYGLGDASPVDAKEIYTPQGIEAGVTVQQRIRGAWYALGGYRYLDQTIRPDSTRGTLRAGTTVGSRGGTIAEATVGVLRDSRDALFNPTRGSLAQVSVSSSHGAIGSDFSYRRVRAEYRAYVGLPQAFTLAVHALSVGVHGSAIPFDQLAMVGSSDIMRGYERGRYRLRTLTAGQLEVRSPLRHRLGGVLFAGAGQLSGGDTAQSARMLPTYGAGLRIELDPRQRTAVRIDYGRGRDGASGLYIGFNQAF